MYSVILASSMIKTVIKNPAPGCGIIKDLADIQLGYQFRTRVEGHPKGMMLLVQVKDVNRARREVDFTSALRFYPERDTTKQLLKPGDVLFMGKGSAPFACVVRDLPGPAVAGGMFFILRAKPRRVFPDYLAWALGQEKTMRALMVASGTGVAMPVIKRSVLEDFRIPLPPLAVQQRIADLARLALDEQELLQEIADQKRALIQVVCERMSKPTEGIRDE